MGTRPPGPTLIWVRRLPTKGHHGQLGWGVPHGALFLAREIPGLVRGQLEFAVDFVPVARPAQGLAMRIGLGEISDPLAGEVGRPACSGGVVGD
jgi:hypothetical protein